MDSFKDKIAVITGAGSGMGYELALSLLRSGCHVAACDLLEDGLEQLKSAAASEAVNARLTVHLCDVASESQVVQFRDSVREQHDTEHINLLFNNAGIGGGGSFVNDRRENWESVFNVCWFGVYYSSRAFMDMLVASDEGYLVNFSSVNGFWASIGAYVPHTSYSAAKFAVKGFSEAMIADLRVNAPHVRVAVVMPGYIATGIAENSTRILGQQPANLSAEEIDKARQQMIAAGRPVDNLSDDEIRNLLNERIQRFRQIAPTTAAEAAAEILEAIQKKEWRILVGDDARYLDQLVRSSPFDAYEPGYTKKVTQTGHLQGLVDSSD